MNSALEVSPQMVSGHTVSNDDRQWDLILRDGCYWHDGERRAGARMRREH